MKVSKLINSLKFKQVQPTITTDFDVTMLTQDTREIQPGAMFIAVDGYHIDGHTLVKQAVEKGAKIIVAQKRINVTVPVVYVQTLNEPWQSLPMFFLRLLAKKCI